MLRVIDGLSRIIERLSFDSERYFLFSLHRTLNFQKKVNSCNLINNGRQHYTFLVVTFNWLKVKCQYVSHSLQPGV